MLLHASSRATRRLGGRSIRRDARRFRSWTRAGEPVDSGRSSRCPATVAAVEQRRIAGVPTVSHPPAPHGVRLALLLRRALKHVAALNAPRNRGTARCGEQVEAHEGKVAGRHVGDIARLDVSRVHEEAGEGAILSGHPEQRVVGSELLKPRTWIVDFAASAAGDDAAGSRDLEVLDVSDVRRSSASPASQRAPSSRGAHAAPSSKPQLGTTAFALSSAPDCPSDGPSDVTGSIRSEQASAVRTAMAR